MKRLFSKSWKPPSLAKQPPPSVNPVPIPHSTGLQPKYVVPPLPHPCPYEHISVLATAQGLLLRPIFPGQAHTDSHVRIAWGKTGVIEDMHTDGESEDINWAESVIVYGIVGILNLQSASYLLVISSRSEVGHLFDTAHAVYGVRGVTAIPLTEERARIALGIIASRNKVDPNLLPTETSDDSLSDRALSGSASEPHVSFTTEGPAKFASPLGNQEFNTRKDSNRPPSPSSSLTSVASTPSSSDYSVHAGAVAKTLAGRMSFWNRLSRRGSVPQPSTSQSTEQDAPLPSEEGQLPLPLDAIIKDDKDDPSQVLDSILASAAPPPPTVEQKHSELEDKIVRECVREFTRGGMYFAYSFDITRSVQHKQELYSKSNNQHDLLIDLDAADDAVRLSTGINRVNALVEPSPTLPLWRRVDRQFWWNEWLTKPFVDAGLHSYVLPIMQGFFQIASFGVPREPAASEEGDAALVDYILVSRRSRDRAGLRYQRRGIDDFANVANFVETETIMRVEREGFSNVFSHVQIRGSIPLFWNQSGYSLKPPPLISPDRTHSQNLDALRRHLQKTVSQYGPLMIVNLAEQQGKEAVVTDAYRQYVTELSSKDVQYHEYDFHTDTKGMKYENISKLIDKMERTFESQGYLWISDGLILSRQRSVFRVNCIDCLDRTNVVESAFARYVLNKQLGAVALLNPADVGRTQSDVIFNDIWANNGDAISREYAGTSALKGDFTRTGKRDLGGLLNDGVNSLARMYSSTFADWFSQAVIDFMLGNRTISVFSEFLLKLQSTDPRDLIRISRIRAEAIATSVSRVLSDGERLLSGWTLFSPAEISTKMSDKFEEKVLLLTVGALYIISYDYTLEKVKMYTRVPLGDILGISKGVYILSTLEEGSRDPSQNYGFVITWRNSNQDTRVTSYSMRNSVDNSPPPVSSLPASFKILRAPSRKSTVLSQILSKAAVPVMDSDTSFAAFKALPIDPTRTRRESGSFLEPADELIGANTCKEAVSMMVDAIRRACEDAGGGHDEFVTDADVVSLAEAQRMTSVYTKMEYGVKRLLWLGG